MTDTPRQRPRSRLGRARGAAATATVAATALAPAAPAGAQGVRVSTVARGLEIPWELAFLPDGRALVTERPDRVRLPGRDGRLRRRPLARVAVSALGEGGLLALALDPAFARNRFVYGWPTVVGPDQRPFTQPPLLYREPLAPSGATSVTRPGSRSTGDFLPACPRGEQPRRIRLRGGRVVADRPLPHHRYGRPRTVGEGPHGDPYALTSNRDRRGRPRPGDDRILRIVPPRR